MASPEALAAVGPYAGFLSRDKDLVASDLDVFVALLSRWNVTHNLVSRETLGSTWPRHIIDSLQLLPLLRPPDRRIVDIGSGGGIPALPLAIASKGAERSFLLVEPVGKKAAFLRTVIRELGLSATVAAARVEQIADSAGAVDLVTSRALAPLSALLSLAFPLFQPQTRALFHKGREHLEEIAEAGSAWSFDVLIHPSVTDNRGAILELSRLRPNA